MQVLLVEDNVDLREEVAWTLSQAGFQVQSFGDVTLLDEALAGAGPFVLVLDLGLPSGDGLETARRWAGVPHVAIIMMTARITRDDRIAGHLSGADVYLTKPVDLDELIAVVHGMQRRLVAGKVNDRVSQQWQLLLNQRQLVCPDDKVLELTGQECRILAILGLNAPHTVTRRKLAEMLGHDHMVFDYRRIEASLSRLRRKAHEQDCCELPIQAMRGEGYAFAAPLFIV